MSVILTVLASTASILSIILIEARAGESIFGSCTRFREYTTSAALKALPL